MTKLLISVRSAAEAQIAYDAGADLIDIKEPSRGSLGAADAVTVEAIARQVAGRLPLSVAMGELLEAAVLSDSLAGRVHYAKFGLAGCRELRDWSDRWQAATARLPKGVAPVAVVYADWQSALAPEPAHVLTLARRLRCTAVLLDTFDKSRGRLTEQLGLGPLQEFIADVHDLGLVCVVAGSLGLSDVAAVARLMPDFVAVRGAACVGDRSGGLDPQRVRRLAAVVCAPSGCDGPKPRMNTEVSAAPTLARFTTRLSD